MSALLISRLGDSRDDIARNWLLRIIERSSIELIGQMRTDRIASELPGLIGELLAEAAADADTSDAERESAARLVQTWGSQGRPVNELAADLAALGSVLMDALRERLDEVGTEDWADAVERVSATLGSIQALVAAETVSARIRELELLAYRDALTGLYNLRFMHEQLDALLNIHERYGQAFALLMIDVDGLKKINDTYGHAAGNRILIAVASTIRAEVRTVDMAFRVGGDEFCVLAPQATSHQASIAAGRLTTVIDNARLPEGPTVGVSIGVAACPEHGHGAEQLLDIADRAMYQAKAGAAHVIVAEGSPN